MPKSNLVQDALRFQIRTGYPKSIAYSGRQWIALGDKIFNYEFNAGNGSLTNPFLYQLDRQGQVQRLFLASKGMWMNGQLQFIGGSLVETQPSAKLVNFQQVPIDSVVGPGYFSTGLNKPFYLSVRQLKDQINIMDARGENTASLKLSLQKKYADPLVPFVLAILGACVGLLFARGKPLRQILVAVLFGVSVIAVTQLFASLGLSYGLPAMVVAWSPTLIFGSVAFYLLASLRT
jgi:lipopolysaccharide export LptBFGC system permease protein LptF